MPVKVGSETLVNTWTSRTQQNQVMTRLASGDYVMAWETSNSATEWIVFAQRYSSNGAKLGGEFQVGYTVPTTSVEPNQIVQYPNVVTLANGNFVVMYRSYGAAYFQGIKAQIFQPNGVEVTPVGEHYLIPYTTLPLSIASLTAGGFVVVWEQNDGGSFGNEVYAQIFDDTGSTSVSAFKVNSYTTNRQGSPKVAGLSSGRFVVVWESDAEDASGYGIYGKIYGPAGQTPISLSRINAITTNDQRMGDVTALSNGNFVVTWQTLQEDGVNADIYARIYTNTGSVVTSEFKVSSSVFGEEDPSVSDLGNGNFVIVWKSKESSGSTLYNIKGQIFDQAGNKVDSEFQVNTCATCTADIQRNPFVIGLTNGNFVVSWESNLQDGSEYGIYMQRYYGPLTATNVNQPISYTEDTNFNLADIVISSPIPTVTATLTLSNTAAGSLSIGTVSGVTSTFSSGVWRASGAIASVNALLAGVQFTPSSNFNGNFVITSSITDGTNTAVSGSMTVTGTPVNDSPQISGSTPTVIFNEGYPPVIVFAAASLSDVDNTNLMSATVRITTNFDSSQDVLSCTPASGITQSYSSGVLTLSGSSSLANYQSTLRSVTYNNISPNPSTGTRTITFQANDGTGLSPSISVSVNVGNVNQVPVISGSTGNAPTFTEGGASVAVDTAISVTDTDDANLASATVTISSGFTAGDTLSFTPQSGISAFYDSANGILTATGSAAKSTYQLLLQSIYFSSNSENPTALSSTRTIQYVVSDGVGPSNYFYKTVPITPINDAPTLSTTSNIPVSYIENGSGVVINSNFIISDPDSPNLAGAVVRITNNFSSSEDVLAFTNQNGITGNYVSSTGTLTLTGTASQANYVAALKSVTYRSTSNNPSTLQRTIRITVNDGQLDSAPLDINVNVIANNGVPQWINNNLIISESGRVVLSGANLAVADSDTSDNNLMFTVSPPLHGHFERVNNPNIPITTFTQQEITNAAIVFVHDGSEFAPSYDVSVTDGASPIGPQSATVTFNMVNDAPVLTVGPLTVTEGGSVTITTNILSASDPDNTNAQLTFYVNPLFGQFELLNNPGVQQLSFTQQQIIDGQVLFVHDGSENAPSFSVSVTDGIATSAAQSPYISFDRVNGAPIVLNAIEDQTATVNQAFDLAIPADTFEDPENEPLVLSAVMLDDNNGVEPLPSWASFDAQSKKLTGTPDQIGTNRFSIFATDPRNASVSTSFNLNVAEKEGPDVPTIIGIASGIITTMLAVGGAIGGYKKYHDKKKNEMQADLELATSQNKGLSQSQSQSQSESPTATSHSNTYSV